MDPTAPNNPNKPNQNTAPQSPIQPGQFVVASDTSTAAPQPQTAPQPVTPQEPAAPVPGMSFAQDKSTMDPIPPAQVPEGGIGAGQPDPAPFANPGQNQQQPTPSAGGGGSKMKVIIIIVAVLLLAGIIAAVVFLFVLPKTSSKTATSVDQTVVNEPTAPPQRTDGGFGQLPQSTGSSEPSTGNELTAPPTNP